VFENIITGDAVDVTIFPTPKWHDGDAGATSAPAAQRRDPDEGWINCGTYRVMIHDAKSSASTSHGQAWPHPTRQIRGAQ
jgi:4-hydroxy-3-polyprenylbenzoate decarboxylase